MENFNPSIITLVLLLFPSFLGSSKSHHGHIAPVNEFQCTHHGFYPHPQTPHKFYECFSHLTTLISYTYNCGAMECFDNGHVKKCSLEACPRMNVTTARTMSESHTEEFTCLKSKLQEDAQKQCEEETLNVLENLMPKMMEFTAHRGDPAENLRLSLREVNTEMRRNYGRLIENTGKNVFPLMVATDGEPDYNGVGGVYKVFLKDGTMKRIVPIRPAYEIHKSLAHLALGVFSIISPYFGSPRSINWQPALRNYQQTLKNVEYLLQNEDTGITGNERSLVLTMLGSTITYIDTAISANSVDMAGYKKYANLLAPFIEQSMEMAAKTHAEDIIPALQKLKEEIGEDEWRRLYVIIPTVWPVSLFNARLQALDKVMSFEQIKNQVLIVEGAQTEADAKTTLGRVVADRAVAQLVWGGLAGEKMKDHVFSLSTRRDLLSSTESRELNKVCRELEREPSKPKCPFAGRTGGVGEDGITKHELFATMLRT